MDKAIDEKEENCPVCISPLIDEPWARIYPCTHPVHTVCAAGWFVQHIEHLQEMVRAYASSQPINEDEKSCPLCRRQWEPENAPVAVAPPPIGGTMEVTNHAMLVAYQEKAKEAAARAAALPPAPVATDLSDWLQNDEQGMGDEGGMESDEESEDEEGEGPPAVAPYIPRLRSDDETMEICELCQRFLNGAIWTSLDPCGCRVHVECFGNRLRDREHANYYPVARLILTNVPCPVCPRRPLHGPYLFASYLRNYPIRPITPDQYAHPELEQVDGVVTSWRVHKECVWVPFVESLRESRDIELEKLLLTNFLTAEEAYDRYRRMGLEMFELMEICYICRRPMACNYWVKVGSCRHQFHLRCLCEHTFGAQNELAECNLVCPVCRVGVVLREGVIPPDFLWRPMEKICEERRTLFHLEEVAFWWEYFRRQHERDERDVQAALQPLSGNR